jgi:hypothetical protein
MQGQASDILIQAAEIKRLKELLVELYVKHCGQDTESVGEWDSHVLPASRQLLPTDTAGSSNCCSAPA